MTGTAISLINKLIDEKAKGDKFIEKGIRVKLILKGIQIDKLTPATPDDPVVIDEIKKVLTEFGIST
ncbi:MAG: hypothetical protein LBD23_06905 [Oscillospiraceae bacterium]|jgi:hypothetical protein|nr:hypothetical protein [Oscillospiraceae bacterium]